MSYLELIELSYKHPIVFYDGLCHLCNGFVNHVIKYDKEAKVKFCLLQNKSGISLRSHLGLGSDINTTIGIYNGKIYTRSNVLHMVIQTVRGWWLLLSPLYLLPQAFRDSIYCWVANRRYVWFGKYDQCLMPDPEVMSRFIVVT